MSDLRVAVRVGAAVERSFNRAFQTAEQRARSLGDAWERSNKKLRATGDVVKYRNLLGELRSSQQVLGSSSAQLNKRIADTERRYEKATQELKSYGIEVGQAAQEHRRLSREIARTERGMRGKAMRKDAKERFSGMRGTALAGAGLLYGAGRAVGAAADREEQANYLRTVINAPDRDAAVGRAVANARQVGRSTDSLATEQEVLEIEYALNSAGLQEEAARAGTTIVHRLAKVTRGVPEQVGEIFGVAFNNMAAGMEGDTEQKMGLIANVLAKTQFKFQIRDFGQLGESLKSAAPAAVGAKLSIEQTAAALGILNTAGQMGSEAGTALQAVLRNLTKASDEFGTSVVRDADGQLDLIATLQQLQEEVDGLDIDERGDLFQKIFGDEGKAGIVPLLGMLDQLKSGYADIQEAAQGNLVNEEYARFLKSSSGQLQILKRNVAQVGVTFAGTLLPAINSVVTPMAQLASRVGGAIERYPVLGKIVGGLAGLVVGAGIATATYAGAMWIAGFATQTMAGQTLLARTVMAGWGLAMKVGAAATWLFNAALWANPLTWVGAAVVAVAGLVWYYWEPISGFFKDLWNSDLVQAWWGAVKGAIKWVGDKLGWLGEKAGAIFEWLGFGGDEVGQTPQAGDTQAPEAGGTRPAKRRRGRGGVAAAAAGATFAAAPAAALPPEAGEGAAVGATFAAAPAAAAGAPAFPAFPAAAESPPAGRAISVTVNGPLTGPITVQIPDGDPETVVRALEAQIGPILDRLLDERLRQLAAEDRLREDDARF